MKVLSIIARVLACACAAVALLTPLAAAAQPDERVLGAMASLKAAAARLGGPRLEGMEAVAGRDAPALYFGSTRVNNSYEVVDAVSQEGGPGMTATFFVLHGDDYVRVSTSVPKPDGSGRAIGTVLDPNGKAIAAIREGRPFYGEVTILGVPYVTGYEPMHDAAGKVIGIYYVGYRK